MWQIKTDLKRIKEDEEEDEEEEDGKEKIQVKQVEKRERETETETERERKFLNFFFYPKQNGRRLFLIRKFNGAAIGLQL